MGCCPGSSSTAPEAPTPATFFFKRRGCTDLCCLIFFAIYMIGMAYITFLSVTVGDPYSVFYGQDYMGSRCGVGVMASKPKTYYPRVDQDLLEQSAIASTMPWKLNFYGLCMEECPNVTTPTACFADPESCKVYDYGWFNNFAANKAAGGKKSYYATMPSISLLNRCVPNDANSLLQDADRCAFPQCDGVNFAPCDETYPTTWKMTFPKSLQCEVKFRVGKIEQLKTTSGGVMAQSIGSKVAGVQRIVDSITASSNEILIFGLALPIVLGFVWLILLRLFAATFTYVMITAIGVALVALTLYLFILAGAADALMRELAGNNTLAVDNASGEAAEYANNSVALAMGLVDSSSTAVASLAPSDLTAAVNAAEEQNPLLWWILAIVVCIITLVYVISMCAARKQIRIAVAIVKQSSMVIKDRPQSMFFPFGTLAAQVLFLFYFVLVFLFLGTASLGPEHFSGGTAAVSTTASYVDKLNAYNASISAAGSLEALKAADDLAFRIQIAVYAYFIFGILWIIESCSNIGWTALSGNVSHWYFFRDDKDFYTRTPLLRSLGRVFRFHLGSIFFGSFIIAVVQFIRLVLLLIDKYTKKQQQANFLLKLAIKCTQCCMYCLEKTLKFITDYCYIYVAMQGSGFCRSCFATFTLIMAHPAQLTINTFVRVILSWVQLLGLPVACAFLVNIVLTAQGKAEVIYPTVLVLLSAYVIAKAFSSVFNCTLNTLFVCCARDKSEYKGQYMPDRLRKAFGFNKKSKKEKAEDTALVGAEGEGDEGGGEEAVES